MTQLIIDNTYEQHLINFGKNVVGYSCPEISTSASTTESSNHVSVIAINEGEASLKISRSSSI